MVQARRVLELYETRREHEAVVFKLQDLSARPSLSPKQQQAEAELKRQMVRLQHQIDGLLIAHRLLPMAFVTFRSSRSAQRALELKELLGKMGVTIGPAPRPTDIKWSHLHVAHKRGCKLVKNAYDVLLSLLMAFVIAMVIIIATMFAQMCLFWVPFNAIFTGWLPVEKAIGGLHWCWGVLMFTLAYELLNQLVALTLTDGGLWPQHLRPKVSSPPHLSHLPLLTPPFIDTTLHSHLPLFHSFTPAFVHTALHSCLPSFWQALKDWYHSRTLGQLRFVKIVGGTEILAMFVGVVLIHPSVLDLPSSLCDFTCLCWWLNPHYAMGSWYDFGAGFAFNALVNAFIGDALINSFVAIRISTFINRR